MVTQSVQRRYALNIAGAYNYLGEIRRGMGRYQEALDYYDKAMEYARDQDAYSSWVVFSCNAGVVCYAMGRYEQAEKYFRQAYELFPVIISAGAIQSWKPIWRCFPCARSRKRRLSAS